MARDDERLERAQESPIVGGLPDVPGIVVAMRLTPGLGVHMEADYDEAAAALLASRTTVFSLDVTNADSHTLEAGLKKVARDTGGFYARTHDFPTSVMKRLKRALSGHYVLVFERPNVPRGTHRVQVDVVGLSGEVLARPVFVD